MFLIFSDSQEDIPMQAFLNDLYIGHWTDPEHCTGCTVFVRPAVFWAGVKEGLSS